MRALNILPRSCYGFLGLDGRFAANDFVVVDWGSRLQCLSVCEE